MDQSDPKGAFGDTLARYYHQSESKTAVAESHPICTVDCGFDYVHYIVYPKRPRMSTEPSLNHSFAYPNL